MAYVFAEFGQVTYDPRMAAAQQSSLSLPCSSGWTVFTEPFYPTAHRCVRKRPDGTAEYSCPPGWTLGLAGTGRSSYSTCVPPVTMASTCPPGQYMNKSGGCSGQSVIGSSGLPGWLSPSLGPAAPRPTNLSADWKSGQCPSGWVFRPGNLLNCLPPRNCGLSQAAACVLPLPVEAGPPRPPSITSDELKRGDVFYSKDPCPQGFVKIDAGTKNEHCRRQVVATADDSKQRECQTGYVLVADQCVKQDVPPPQIDVEVKTAGAPDWVSDNWKWLLAVATAGGVVYWWTKRKAV